MQPDTTQEWKWVLNNLWYSLAVFIVRWIMPMGIRQACYMGEVEMLTNSFPPRKKWNPEDFVEFSTAKAQLEQQYRMPPAV